MELLKRSKKFFHYDILAKAPQFLVDIDIILEKLPYRTFKIMDKDILIIEPYYGGSHKRLIDALTDNLLPQSYDLITMTAKKWHWRARTSPLYISQQIPKKHSYKILFCTSVLPLAELLGIRSDLVKLLKVVYFHENQLVYPVQTLKDRDYQYGYNEILTTLAADKVLFNSNFNKISFLSNIKIFLKKQPDYKTSEGLSETIASKCAVVYFPIDLKRIDTYRIMAKEKLKEAIPKALHIVWPHRWEFDKDPDALFTILCDLEKNTSNFMISILGESYSEKPKVFEDLKARFSNKILNYGYVESEAEYYKILLTADVVLSTAIHEFFGVSVMEAVYCGCIPVVPNRLAYKEFFDGVIEEIYADNTEAVNILTNLCNNKALNGLHKDYTYLVMGFDTKTFLEKFFEITGIQNDMK